MDLEYLEWTLRSATRRGTRCPDLNLKIYARKEPALRIRVVLGAASSHGVRTENLCSNLVREGPSCKAENGAEEGDLFMSLVTSNC